jgi:hypothetical protein
VGIKLTVGLEVEEGWKESAIWKAGVGVSKLIKEWVNKCLHLVKRFTDQNRPQTQRTMLVSCVFPLCNMQLNILTAVHRRLGEYWSSLETRSTASGGILLWKT